MAIYWPVPPWLSFWEFDLFLGLWNVSVELAKGFAEPATPPGPGGSHHDKVEYLIYSWINCAMLALERKPVPRPSGASQDDVQWTALVARLGRVLEKATAESDDAMIGWFRELTAFLMPESIGNRPEILSEFAKSDIFRAFWGREASEIIRFRLDTLARMRSSGLSQFALEVGSVPIKDAIDIQLQKREIGLFGQSQ